MEYLSEARASKLSSKSLSRFFVDVHFKSPLMDDLITKNNYLRIAIAIPINMCNGILANLLYLFAYIPVGVTTYLSSTGWSCG